MKAYLTLTAILCLFAAVACNKSEERNEPDFAPEPAKDNGLVVQPESPRRDSTFVYNGSHKIWCWTQLEIWPGHWDPKKGFVWDSVFTDQVKVVRDSLTIAFYIQPGLSFPNIYTNRNQELVFHFPRNKENVYKLMEHRADAEIRLFDDSLTIVTGYWEGACEDVYDQIDYFFCKK